MLKKSWWVIILTNQSGLARAKFSWEEYLIFHKALETKLRDQDAAIDAWYMSPFHPEAKLKEYAFPCLSRKPELECYLWCKR